MKAFFATAYGGPEVMRFGELPDPRPGQGEVLVAVRASSVNPVDYKVRSGALKVMTGGAFPKVYGTDFAGVVAELGPGAAGFAVGDEVYGTTTIMLRRPGAQAERVAVACKNLRRKPASMTFEIAAAMPVAGLTATHGLRLAGPLAGKAVIVNGASGGVGHFAVQVARAMEADVTAVCSGRNAEFVRGLGVDKVLDYGSSDFTRQGLRYGVVYDAYGLLGFKAARRALEGKGIYVTPLPGPSAFLHSAVRRVLGGQRCLIGNLRTRPEDYSELEQLIASGAVKPQVTHVVPLSEAARAYELIEKGGLPGKVVIAIG